MSTAFIFEGGVGTGKTFSATAMVYWLALQGRRVAHNWEIAWPKELRQFAVRFEGFEEIMGTEDIDIFFDEAQSAAGSRDWEAMPKKVRNWLSHHRHYGNNLIFLTQHYKFVDVYIRRLAPKGVWSVWRFLNLTIACPFPDANPETGELGMPKVMGTRLFIRPWKDLDHPYPIGGFFDLLSASRQVPGLYGTRDKATIREVRAPVAAAPPHAPGAPQDSLPFID